ncbi:hypothetical protein Tco_0238153 [Tanacetum coccineum]
MSNTNTNLQTQTSSVLQNDTVSSCSISKVQEKTQLSRIKCMKSLRAIQSQLKFLTDTLQDFGTMPIFKRTFSQDLDLLEQHLTKEIISQTDCKTTLTKLRTTLNLELSYIIQNTCSEKEDSNSENASNKLVKECSLNSETKDVHAIKYKMSKAKERCMAYFRSLHSLLQVLSKDDLKGTRIEHGYKRAFMSLFGQDVDTFTRTMLLNVDRLQKQLDKDEFQEDGSMTAFWVVNNQFQNFIDSKFTLDYDSQMTDTRFVQYTGIEVQHFRDTLLQHLGNVKKSVAERTRHKRQYERRVNKRQMQTQESKIDTGKALYVDLVDDRNIRTASTCKKQQACQGLDIRMLMMQDDQTHNERRPMAEDIGFSIKKYFRCWHEKTMTPRSCLRWKPTGKILKTVGLRWVPTGKIFTPSTTKVDNEPPNGSNADITNQYESAQTLDVCAGTSNLSAEVPTSNMIVMTLMPELESLFGPLFDEYFNGENQVVLKSSAVTTTDASNKRQQQPDSTSSTSTLATTVTANGNFNL